ncbi:MAG: ribose 5-phosphate isomerase B [Deltaproteobacteria bacterium]|nr:ribose 5-phosphate isomerase B [Deltaproteobacteria bacterium]
MKRKVIAGSDHGGYALKAALVARLREDGWDVEDVGVETERSVDYPTYAFEVAKRIVADPNALGLLICGTGLGMSVAANKVPGIRATVCSEPYSSTMARRHNDANVLCMGGRVVGPELGWSTLSAFLETEFEGGRHQRRLDLIAAAECGSLP